MLQTVVHAVFVQFIYNHVSISQSILRCLVLRKTVTLRAHKTSELRRSTMGVVTTWDTVVVTTLDIVMETIMVTAAERFKIHD